MLITVSPLALKKVPPNRWYGFRTATTLADERMWYRVNAGTGLSFVACGMIAFGVAMVRGIVPLRNTLAAPGFATTGPHRRRTSGITLERAVRHVEYEQRRAKSNDLID